MDNQILRHILMNKVREVSAKIGFDESKVTWKIYRNWRMGDAITLFQQREINDYGYCYPKQKTVYIEEQLILGSLENQNIFRTVFSEKSWLRNRVTLESVLIDEITHIQTGLDHGTEGYEKQFQLNWDRYLGNGTVISRIAPQFAW